MGQFGDIASIPFCGTLGHLRSEKGVQQGAPSIILPGSEHPGVQNHIQWSLPGIWMMVC